jgi:hypothetical protein
MMGCRSTSSNAKRPASSTRQLTVTLPNGYVQSISLHDRVDESIDSAPPPEPAIESMLESGCVGTLRTHIVNGRHGIAEVGQPIVGVLSDEAHAPGERIGA